MSSGFPAHDLFLSIVVVLIAALALPAIETPRLRLPFAAAVLVFLILGIAFRIIEGPAGPAWRTDGPYYSEDYRSR